MLGACVDPALPQMDQVSARLRLAGAAQVVRLIRRAVERAGAVDDDVMIEQRLVLGGKGVERSMELVRRHHQRRRESFAMPGVGERAERVEVVGAGCCWRTPRPRLGRPRRARRTDRRRRGEGRRPCAGTRAATAASSAGVVITDHCSVPPVEYRRASADVEGRLFWRRHRTAERARRTEARAVDRSARHRHDVRQRRVVGPAARRTGRAAARATC